MTRAVQCAYALAMTMIAASCGSSEDAGGSASATAASPAAVAESYLRAGSTSDAAAVRANLDPACHGVQAMTDVNAVRIMGVPITIAELTVTEQSREADQVVVRYAVSGSAHGSGGTTVIFGATVTMDDVNIENASQSGTLTLREIDGQYRVTCATP